MGVNTKITATNLAIWEITTDIYNLFCIFCFKRFNKILIFDNYLSYNNSHLVNKIYQM